MPKQEMHHSTLLPLPVSHEGREYGHTQRRMRGSSEYSTVRWVTSATARI